MSPGGVTLPYLVPHIRPPKENRGHVQTVETPVRGKLSPSQGHQRREDVQGAGERGGFHQSKEQRSPEGPPNPTCTPQPPRPGGLLAAPMAGDCLGVRAAASQHPSQQPSSAEKVKTGFKQRLGPGKPSLRTLPIPSAGCSPGAAGSARIRGFRTRQIPHPQSREMMGNGAAPSHPPVSPPDPGKAADHPPEKVLAQGFFYANDSRSRRPRKMWSRFCTAQHEPSQPEWKMRAVLFCALPPKRPSAFPP